MLAITPCMARLPRKSICTYLPTLAQCMSRSLLVFGRLGRRGEFAGDDRAQQRAKLRSAFRAKCGFELRLRSRPCLERGLQTFFACIGQVEFLGTAVGGDWFDPD